MLITTHRCNVDLVMSDFYHRIFDCVDADPSADREGDHRENVPEINAEQNGNFLRQLFGNNLSDDVGAHFAAVIKSAEHNTPDVFLAVCLQKRLEIAVKFIFKIIAHDIVVLEEQHGVVSLRHKLRSLKQIERA